MDFNEILKFKIIFFEMKLWNWLLFSKNESEICVFVFGAYFLSCFIIIIIIVYIFIFHT
jgi:hypothetical protein